MRERGEKPVILVCDDERHLVSLVRYKLEQLGYEVIVAHDGERALLLSRERQPDLVISDYQMPRMDGLQFARALEQDGRTAGTPVILVSGRGFTLSPTDLAGTGVRQILPKPFSPKELLFHANECLAALGWGDAA